MTPTRISAILITYNQADFVRDALQSLLDQDWESLEIVVSDDASTDQTWIRICEVADAYVGTKQLTLLRQTKNLGIVGNFNAALARASGDLFLLAAGDDVSLPTRCTESHSLWHASGHQLDLVATDAYDMLPDGTLLGVKSVDDLETWTLDKWFTRRPYHFGASYLVTRRLVELCPLRQDLSGEDQVLMFRAILKGGAKRLAKPLVKHRRGGVSTGVGPKSYEVKHTKLLQGAMRSLIESEQLLEDARAAGAYAQVVNPLQTSIRLQNYMVSMLTALTQGERLGLLVRAHKIPWDKRLRFFAFCSATGLYKVLFWLKWTRK